MINFCVRTIIAALWAGSIIIAGHGSALSEDLPWQKQPQVGNPYEPSASSDQGNSGVDRSQQQSDPYYQSPPGSYSSSGPAYSQTKPHNADGADRFAEQDDQYYSQSEIIEAGHHFFGKLSEGLAKAVETLFRKQGRPTGYILGQDASGAFIAGLRYGEGYLHTKYGDKRKVFWQGPTLGYDFGGEGSRTMVLVYNLHSPGQIYRRFGGVQGSAYVIGGAGVQLLKNENIMLAPIRTGVGLRFGANIGYLKYTSRPTWNPF